MKTPSAYLAILNNGWIRSELHWGLLKMARLSEIPITFEDPQLTRGQPSSSVRCKLVKRFLASNRDYLIMLDNDQVPFHDLVDIVLAMDKKNLAVVSCPAQTKQKGRMQWMAYSAYDKVENGYVSTDLDSLKSPPDFLERDAVGTGCMIIRRDVLEIIKAPFEDKFDDDGIRILGHDLHFCEKVRAKGYKVYTTPKKRCEHFKCVGVTGLEADKNAVE